MFGCWRSSPFWRCVLDAFSRRVIGWALETHLRASLATAALQMAIAARRPAPGSLIHHSDRGVQYACGEYTRHAGSARHPAEHEPHRQSLRQRQGGELHEDTQAGGGRRPRLSRSRAKPATRSAPSSRTSTIATDCTRPWPIGPRPSSKPNLRAHLWAAASSRPASSQRNLSLVSCLTEGVQSSSPRL